MARRATLAAWVPAVAVAFAAGGAYGDPAPDQISEQLNEIIRLHGWQCGSIVAYEQREADEYLSVCEDGNQYLVVMTAHWNWGGDRRQTGLKVLLDVSDQVDRLTSDDAGERRDATQELEALGANAEAAVPFLISSLKDDDVAVRSGAAIALGAIGSGAEIAVPDLIEALKDPAAEVRISARDALAQIRQTK